MHRTVDTEDSTKVQASLVIGKVGVLTRYCKFDRVLLPNLIESGQRMYHVSHRVSAGSALTGPNSGPQTADLVDMHNASVENSSAWQREGRPRVQVLKQELS